MNLSILSPQRGTKVHFKIGLLNDIQIYERGVMMIKNRIQSDHGLMGPTHALSSVAFALLFTWLASDVMFDKILGSKNVIVFISAMIIIVGASLMPDLDAVKSTSINVLGFIGTGLSKSMRGFSTVVQGLIKGPYDKSSDPHRGFWHTLVAAFLVGLGVSGLTKIDIELFTIKSTSITFSTLIVMLLLYLSIQLALSSLFKKLYNKHKNKIGKLGTNLGSLFFAGLLVYLLPSHLDYTWVGGAVIFGWVSHLLGDMMTVAGVPILFPLKIKGKRWWDLRLPLGIKAGGFIEYSILVPLFTIIAAISLYNILPLFQ